MHSNEVAKLAGVTVRTLRHYHQLGLLSEPPRQANGYRDYSPADVARVLRITRLADLGFPLSRIGDVLDEMDAEGNATPASALDELEDPILFEKVDKFLCAALVNLNLSQSLFDRLAVKRIAAHEVGFR